MSETCRVIINQVKQKLHLVGYLLIQYYKDARYHEHKKKKSRFRSSNTYLNFLLKLGMTKNILLIRQTHNFRYRRAAKVNSITNMYHTGHAIKLVSCS